MPGQAYRKVGGEQEAARGKGQLAAQVRPAHGQRELAPHLHHRGREDAEKTRRKDFVRPDQGSPGTVPCSRKNIRTITKIFMYQFEIIPHFFWDFLFRMAIFVA